MPEMKIPAPGPSDTLSLVLILGRKSVAKRIKGGHFEKRKCPECEATTVLREIEVSHDYNIFFKIKLFDTSETTYACDSCNERMDLEDTLEPELSQREQELNEKAAEKSERKRIKEDAKAAKKRDKEVKSKAEQHDREINNELAEMKKRLGL